MVCDMADAKKSSSNEFSESPTNLLLSCLRSRKGLPKQHLANRSVSFPEDDNQIVTGYLEPPNPWEYAENASKDSVISQYIKSCERHGTRPISCVLDQLQGYELSGERVDCLDLKGEPLSTASCEALEEIFKRVQLIKVDLDNTSLDDESSVVMFDMIEYYEAATQLNISHNIEIGGRGWQACSRMLKRAKCLELLECRGTPLTEQYMTILSRAFRIGTQLQVLKLENCSLSGRPMVNLVAALKMNTVLKELHLGENCLNCHDALQLGTLLKNNNVLQLLDVGNNSLEDVGVNYLCEGLIEQPSSPGPGLNMLVLWNNRLTNQSAEVFCKTLLCVSSLEVLNIGRNNLGDEVLSAVKDALSDSRTLTRLGIQSTQLSCKGARTLAEIIAENSSLQRIDVRDNNILVDGLKALCEVMKSNKTLTRLDIDAPRHKESINEEELETYTELWDRLRVECRENESSERDQEVLERMKTNMRKISLTCNTLKLQAGGGLAGGGLLEPRSSATRLLPGGRLRSPAPSPIPSPVTSPSPTRTRFQVSRVAEESPVAIVSPGGGSRFKVTVVDPGAQGAEPTKTSSNTSISSNEEESGRGVVSRAGRKLTSWVNPSLLTENRTVEKLLGLFPWGRGPGAGGPPAQDLLNNNTTGSSGATWPPQQPPPPPPVQPPQQHSTSTPSLVHTGS